MESLILIPFNRTRPELFVGEVKCLAPIPACALNAVIKVIDSLLFIYYFYFAESFVLHGRLSNKWRMSC